MKVGDLVSARWEDWSVGLITRIRHCETRVNACYVQWANPDGCIPPRISRWYDENDLKLIEPAFDEHVSYSADPM